MVGMVMSGSGASILRTVLRRTRSLIAVEPVFRSLGLLPAPWRWPAYARLVGGNPYADPTDGEDRESLRRILPHRYLMRLSRSDWRERYAIRVGHYWQPTVVAVMQKLLRRGDAVIDIGANIGFTTLTAARYVGETGRVLAIEPNPFLTERLSECLETNGLGNVEVATVALDDHEGSVQMALGRIGHGRGRVATAPEANAVPVPVRRGDDLFQPRPGERVFIKADVEGYEWRALSGMPAVLSHPDLACLVEITDSWLVEFGASAATLFEMLHRNGMRGYLPRLSPTGRLRLDPLAEPVDSFQYDALFVKGSFADGLP